MSLLAKIAVLIVIFNLGFILGAAWQDVHK